MTSEILCHFAPHFTPHISAAKPDCESCDDSLTGDLRSDCRFAGQTGLVPVRETLHCEPLRAPLHPLIFNIPSTWEGGGGRREGQLELRRRLEFLHFIPITKHYYQRAGSAGPDWGWLDANIMIVFTPIKIPNNLTLSIYIIRSQAQPARQPAC